MADWPCFVLQIEMRSIIKRNSTGNPFYEALYPMYTTCYRHCIARAHPRSSEIRLRRSIGFPVVTAMKMSSEFRQMTNFSLSLRS